MTKQQATDIAAQIGVGVEVREHPKCGGGTMPFYYAVCGVNGVVMSALDCTRQACMKAGCAFSVEQSPAWAADCEWAVY